VNSEENATGNYKILQEVDAEETKNTTQFWKVTATSRFYNEYGNRGTSKGFFLESRQMLYCETILIRCHFRNLYDVYLSAS
jgi:hypothetical protein